MNENEIIKNCLKNNRESQKALYELYYNKMLSVCLRYSKDSTEAQDILHEGFFKIFGTLKNYKDNENFEAWIKTIMIETAIEHLKKNSHNLIVSTFYANKAGSINTTEDEITEDDLIRSIDNEIILKAVQELTPAYRKVFNLFLINGYTHKKIAELLDTSEETSESNLIKAKYSLQKNLKQLLKKSNG